MNTLRYFLALVLVVALPPLFLYWVLIHPLIAFWRAQGLVKTYSVVLTIILFGMLSIFSLRHALLTVDWATNYWLIGLGVICLCLAGKMRLALDKHLSLKAMLGLPEIAPESYPRRLITEGIYSQLRHPRYVQLLIALIGYALMANYFAVYCAVALWVPGIYVIALLEEQELRDHFGEEYEAYAKRAPRFIPKFLRLHRSGSPSQRTTV
jgi:protein-S-isoprenylcysteine O-methyltransferase Ste14